MDGHVSRVMRLKFHKIVHQCSEIRYKWAKIENWIKTLQKVTKGHKWLKWHCVNSQRLETHPRMVSGSYIASKDSANIVSQTISPVSASSHVADFWSEDKSGNESDTGTCTKCWAEFKSGNLSIHYLTYLLVRNWLHIPRHWTCYLSYNKILTHIYSSVHHKYLFTDFKGTHYRSKTQGKLCSRIGHGFSLWGKWGIKLRPGPVPSQDWEVLQIDGGR